ncbi:MAG TPA: hypothetical protein VGR22_04620 [Thermomicrobiales bacterium]|nr:hypothetical protein [Thermomicrobiales bacterium]
MLLTTLLAMLLGVVQTPQAADDDPNLFLDLGSEHCATEIAFAAFERTDEDAAVTNVLPAYVTYSAFQFETAEQAEAALEDAPVLVAETFSDDPDIGDTETFDQIANEVQTEDYGDRTLGYAMTLPVDNEALDNALTVELLGIVKHDQLVLILLFSEAGPRRLSPTLTLDTVPPFAEDLDEDWDGTGDPEEAIPDEEGVPIGWERREVTIDDPPSC